MPRATTRKRSAAAPKTSEIDSLDLMRTGMPARDSIVKVWRHSKPSAAKKASGAKATKAAAASGRAAFRIIRTNEVDGYEKGATAQGIPPSCKSCAMPAATIGAGGRNPKDCTDPNFFPSDR